MWIMLTTKLPVRPSPPKLAIFWSVAWPDTDRIDTLAKQSPHTSVAATQYHRFKEESAGLLTNNDPEQEPYFLFDGEMGKQPNWIAARAIQYKGEKIRVFPHEFSAMTTEKMRAFVLGEGFTEATHKLRPDGVISEREINRALKGTSKKYYDAALVDGCDHDQALAVALGIDITLPDAQFPPVGWYECLTEHARYYCTESEMK